MLGLAPHYWVHLAWVSDGEKMYLGPSILIKIYPTLSATIRGQDWVDACRAYWMTLPFWEASNIFQIRRKLMDLVDI